MEQVLSIFLPSVTRSNFFDFSPPWQLYAADLQLSKTQTSLSCHQVLAPRQPAELSLEQAVANVPEDAFWEDPAPGSGQNSSLRCIYADMCWFGQALTRSSEF